jgi:hypothetical protein
MTKTIKIFITLLLLTMLATAFFFVSHSRNKQKISNNKQSIEVRTFNSSNGWGYKIDINEKTYIYQPFIPTIGHNLGFESEEVAERVGEIVKNKIIKHQSPSMSINELLAAGVKIDSAYLKKRSTN